MFSAESRQPFPFLIQCMLRAKSSTFFLEKIISSAYHIDNNAKWKQDGLTIAGGNGQGNHLNQLNGPCGIYVDDNHQCIYIADLDNHRIVQQKYGATIGQVVAGGNGQGNRMDQLSGPRDVTVDENTDSLIICDFENRRVVRWPRQNGTNGQTIISDIKCACLTMDNNEELYLSDFEKGEVRCYRLGRTNGTIVAGGNGSGNQLSQLDHPTGIYVDQDYSVYVSDHYNHRVMKWMKGAKEGIVVAGGNGKGDNLRQLNSPNGLIVDDSGNVYVADSGNNRVMCWSKGSKEGRVIVGGNGYGQQSNQFAWPIYILFGRHGNIYVADYSNHRIQKFDINLS